MRGGARPATQWVLLGFNNLKPGVLNTLPSFIQIFSAKFLTNHFSSPLPNFSSKSLLMLQNNIEETNDHFQSSIFKRCGKCKVFILYNISYHFFLFWVMSYFFPKWLHFTYFTQILIRNPLMLGFGFSFVFICIPKIEFSTTVSQSSEQNCTESWLGNQPRLGGNCYCQSM